MENKLVNYLLIGIWVVMAVGLISVVSFNIPVGTTAWDVVFAVICVITYSLMTIVAYEAFDALKMIRRREKRAKLRGRKLARHIKRAEREASRRINSNTTD